MKRVVWQGVAACLLCLFVAAPAFGAGFALYEFSARGNALGGSTVASGGDPSAIAINPACITGLEGTQVMMGVSAIGPASDVSVTTGGATYDNNQIESIFYPPHMYVTHQLNDDIFLGLGVFSRFGLGTEYDDNWPGRYNVYQVLVASYSINPNLAVRLTDALSVAVGVEAMKFELDRYSRLDGNAFTGAAAPYNPVTTNTDIDEHQDAESWGVGVNLGFRYEIDDQWAVGAHYRSKMRQELDGVVTYSDPNNQSALVGGALFNDVGITGKIILPDSFNMGVAYKPMDNLSMELSAVYTRWSSYDAYTIEYQSRAAVGRDELSSTKNWNDVWRYQFGVEYTPIEWLDLRASYLYDESPIPADYADYMLPTYDRQMVGVGAGVRYDAWQFDVSYNYLWMQDRDIAADGRTRYNSSYRDSHAHIGGVSVSYKF